MDYFYRLMLRANAEPYLKEKAKIMFDPFEQFAIDTLPVKQEKQGASSKVNDKNALLPIIEKSIQMDSDQHIEMSDEKAHQSILADSQPIKSNNIQPEKSDVFQKIEANEQMIQHKQNSKLRLNSIYEDANTEKIDLLNTADQFMQKLSLPYLQIHQDDSQHQNIKLNQMNEVDMTQKMKSMANTIAPIKSNMDVANHEKTSWMNSNEEKQIQQNSVSQTQQHSEHMEKSNKKASVERIIEKHIVINHGNKTWSEAIQNSHSSAFGMGQL